MKNLFYIFILMFIAASCNSQNKNSNNNRLVGGPCEGCEAVYEYDNRKLINTDTLPDFIKTEPKLKILGTVFEEDGKTPADDVILYIYHTDRNGIYAKKGDEKGWAKRHGYIRGWIKTNKTGNYTFYTFRPAAYPNRIDPEHIHITVKEPTRNEYYIDEILFDDDPLLTQKARKKLGNRGGSGIMKPKFKNNILTVRRDIILGRNIPNYDNN